jgi:hypothetical protein
MLEDLIPSAEYSFEIRKKSHEIPPFELKGPLRIAEEAKKCEGLEEALAALDAVDDEGKVSRHAERVRTAIKAADPIACAMKLADAHAALEATHRVVGDFTLERGEFLAVTVKRKLPSEKTWTAVFDAGPRGSWQASYAFAFLSGDDRHYFTKAVDGGKFQVSEEQDRGGLSFAPLVFYSWFPAKTTNRALSLGLAGGLGFEGTDPVVALGVNLSFNQNLGLVAGGAMRRVSRLSGRYDENDLPILEENLDSSQLETKVYRPAAFIALTFRFGSEPGTHKEPAQPAGEDNGAEKKSK